MRRGSHFIRDETVFAHFKESGFPMKIQDWTRTDYIRKELIFCKETFLSRTEKTGCGRIRVAIRNFCQSPTENSENIYFFRFSLGFRGKS